MRTGTGAIDEQRIEEEEKKEQGMPQRAKH